MKSMVEIFNQYNCDKGSQGAWLAGKFRNGHRYDRVYEPAHAEIRNKKFNLLEIGIFKGDSMRAWVDYFPNANLYGIDIFTRVSAKDIPILKASRVKWCNCDSVKGPNSEFIDMINGIKFDTIIDDGLHTHAAQRQTFENFFPYLKEGGSYFIEDVWPLDRSSAQQREQCKYWLETFPDEFSDDEYNKLLETLKSYDTKFHDLRKGHELDTFIIEVTK